MKPLFAGVSQILAEGLAFTEVDNKNNIVSMYTVHNGNFYIDQVPVIRFPLSEFDSKNAKIAVLTSRYTNGAAELLAIALRGKKNTKFFGESTAGNVLGMKAIAISKDLAMKLASTFYVDRKGIEYLHAINPDEEVEFIEVTNQHSDRGIKEAMAWLNNLPETVVTIGMN
jgi:C-terminal processing protease CtpA/Prc